MRKLVFGINLTLDGCCDHTKGMADEEVHNFYTDLLHESDTFLWGRKTFQLMVPFWPDVARDNSGVDQAMNNFAKAFIDVRRIVVFSKSLTSVKETNVTIARDDLREEVLRLKQQEGQKILTGGVDVPSQLIKLGLVDEFYFVVQPLLAGEGRRLLENFSLQTQLRLVDTKIFKSGCVALHYEKM